MILLDTVVSSGEDIEVHYITKYLNIVASVSVLFKLLMLYMRVYWDFNFAYNILQQMVPCTWACLWNLYIVS